MYRFIQWKTFFIGEDALEFFRDTIVTSPTIPPFINRVNTNTENSTLNQLRFVIRKLQGLISIYGELKIEQGKRFYPGRLYRQLFFQLCKRRRPERYDFLQANFSIPVLKPYTKQFETDRLSFKYDRP